MRCFYVLKKWSFAKLSLNRDLSLNKMSLNRDCTVLSKNKRQILFFFQRTKQKKYEKWTWKYINTRLQIHSQHVITTAEYKSKYILISVSRFTPLHKYRPVGNIVGQWGFVLIYLWQTHKGLGGTVKKIDRMPNIYINIQNISSNQILLDFVSSIFCIINSKLL